VFFSRKKLTRTVFQFVFQHKRTRPPRLRGRL
jgi:hypothetical protein